MHQFFVENQALFQDRSSFFKVEVPPPPFLFGVFLMYCYLIYTSVGRIYSGVSALYIRDACLLSSSAILLICQLYSPAFPGCYYSLPTVAAVFCNCKIFFLDIKGGVPGTPPPPGHGPARLLVLGSLSLSTYTRANVGKKTANSQVRLDNPDVCKQWTSTLSHLGWRFSDASETSP